MPVGQPDKIKVGLLLDECPVAAWIGRLIELLRSSPDVELALALITTELRAPQKIPAFSHLLYRFYLGCEAKVVRPDPNAFAPLDAKRLLKGIPELRIGECGLRNGDVARIAEAGLDVLLAPDEAELDGEILAAARCGVWTLRHGDGRACAGTPPGFREVFDRWTVTGSRLVRLGRPPEDDLVIRATSTSTAPLSVARNRHKIYWKALHLVPRALAELRRLGPDAFMKKIRLENAPKRIERAQTHPLPTNREFLPPLIRQLCRFTGARLSEALTFSQWFVMIGQEEPAPARDLRRFRKLLPPAGRFWADPFIVRRDGHTCLFVEEMPKPDGKGHIAVMTLNGAGWSAPIKALERPYHISYPFIFEWDGQIYMLPETLENRTVELYRCTRWPDQWAFERNLLEGVQAVDATLHAHGGKWWLFANIKESEEIADTDELFLFSADSPVSDQWTPHRKNPVVSDVRSARPAGRLFERNGVLYRPSQNCAPDYGAGIRINKVLRLDEEEYAETPVETLEPRWDRKVQGLHTLNFIDGMTVIDARRRRFKFF